jgi:4-hydroxy-3-methylbut-2-en-1-yl diphosphate reductase
MTKLNHTPMNIHLAHAYGMCFGVRDALRATHTAAERAPITILGQLVHNPVVEQQLQAAGAEKGDLSDLASARTNQVVITAHGASDRHRTAWRATGHQVIDTTCPLVHKAHQALAQLVREGYQPIVIGQREHVEVRGLMGDFPHAHAALTVADLDTIPPQPKFGLISQTTQPIELARGLVAALRERFPASEVRFIDTVCQPTKQRQTALEDLCHTCELVVVIGGQHSNNTRQLAQKATTLGAKVYQIEGPHDLRPEWFAGVQNVGITAGTSTLDETVQAVITQLHTLNAASPGGQIGNV